MAFVAPNTFDNSQTLLQSLGTFWDRWFPDRDTINGLLSARGEPFYQVYLGLLDLVASHCRFEIPVFQKKYWSLLAVLESQKDSSAQLNILYDTTGLEYQNSSYPAYGSKENMKYHSYAIDPLIKEVHAVYNRVVSPSMIWMNNQDFVVDPTRGLITFYTDPFEDPLVPKRDILDSAGTVVDREIALWLSLASWDMQYVYTQFGYALKIWMESSEYYKQFISTIWDNLVVGTTQTSLKASLSAVTGIPFAREVETVVRIIDESPQFKHVETDKNIYTFKASAIVIVSPGDVLAVGDPLTMSVVVFEPDISGVFPATAIEGFAMGPNLMSSMNLAGQIVFENKDVDVEYLGLDANQKAIVRFSVSGFATDVENFWHRAHSEGLRINRTMADVLDKRIVRASPTTAADLPATINPFEFVTSHIFSNNLYIIYMQPDTFPDGVPGVGSLDYLYAYLSPHTTYVIFVENSPIVDYYNVGNATELPAFLKGASMSDSAGVFANDLGPVFHSYPGRCM